MEHAQPRSLEEEAQMHALRILSESEELSGRELREKVNAAIVQEMNTLRQQTRSRIRKLLLSLASHMCTFSLPSFYGLMAGLESAGEVEGWYQREGDGDDAHYERRYRIMVRGRSRLDGADYVTSS